LLKGNPIPWLLEENTPSVRYFTLTDLEDKPGTDPDVVRAKERIMNWGTAPKILEEQGQDGHWSNPEDFYVRAKYRGTVWQLIILAELGADGRDRRVAKACEFVLEHSQDRESGAFSYKGTPGKGGRYDCVLPCLTGNMVWSLIRLGYLHDPRLQRAIQWIISYQRFDDRCQKAPAGWPYEGKEKCWGRHSCFMGVVKALKALAEIPPHLRSREVQEKLDQGKEFLLAHRIFRRSHDLSQISIPSWLQFGFPDMWDTDALEILEIFTKLRYRDNRMQEAIELLVSKQSPQGQWILERTFNGRFLVSIETKGKPSKWITLKALRVLKFYEQ